MPTEYASVRLRADVFAQLRSLGRRVSFEQDRDIAHSDLIGAALEVAERHYEELELTRALAPGAPEGATNHESHESRRE